MMRFGVCCGPAAAPALSQAGYDFFEGSVPGILKPLEDAAAFDAMLDEVRRAPLPCEALNLMVPAEIKLTGPETDPARQEAYMKTMCARAARAGIARVVFGSGGARKVPDGFPKEKAFAQLADFLRMAAPYAADAGTTIVVEPLNRNECNIINSVAEGAELVREVNAPSVRLLADSYHMLRDDEPLQNITDHAALLAHVHVATGANRLPPGVEPDHGLQEFLLRLRDAGYNGRVSVEAGGMTPAHLWTALATLRLWTQG